ncbi:hypothetical protein M569_09465 [Genlisea aurea]|uniref:Retroviral polymerase SH3-like domain-containing protein n=1 Tax=Genlisea aurea TaxID=192259 RepID=S8CEB9_9LAMI|nr:hypothetical protein M569_09465 [Genlisea aurea]
MAYAHVSDANKKKLDDRSRACVMLGVSDESKAYRLYDPVADKILISKDVIFDEQKRWDWGTIVNPDTIEFEGVMEDDEIFGENPSAEDSTDQHVVGNHLDDVAISPEQPEQPDGEHRRPLRPPRWLQDYVTVDDLEANNAFLMLLGDLVTEDSAENSEEQIHFLINKL